MDLNQIEIIWQKHNEPFIRGIQVIYSVQKSRPEFLDSEIKRVWPAATNASWCLGSLLFIQLVWTDFVTLQKTKAKQKEIYKGWQCAVGLSWEVT